MERIWKTWERRLLSIVAKLPLPVTDSDADKRAAVHGKWNPLTSRLPRPPAWPTDNTKVFLKYVSPRHASSRCSLSGAAIHVLRIPFDLKPSRRSGYICTIPPNWPEGKLFFPWPCILPFGFSRKPPSQSLLTLCKCDIQRVGQLKPYLFVFVVRTVFADNF